MASYDIEAARRAGLSDKQILAEHFAKLRIDA